MPKDDESQPHYSVGDKMSRPEQKKPKEWEPEVIKPQTREHALRTMMKDDFLNSPEWQKFCDLVGKDTAIEWARAGLFSATRTD